MIADYSGLLRVYQICLSNPYMALSRLGHEEKRAEMALLVASHRSTVYINTQIHKYKYTNPNIQIQIYKYKYTNTNTQIKIHKYKYTNTNTQTRQ